MQRPWGGNEFGVLGDSKEAKWLSRVGDRRREAVTMGGGLGILLPVMGSPSEGWEQRNNSLCLAFWNQSWLLK